MSKLDLEVVSWDDESVVYRDVPSGLEAVILRSSFETRLEEVKDEFLQFCRDECDVDPSSVVVGPVEYSMLARVAMSSLIEEAFGLVN